MDNLDINVLFASCQKFVCPVSGVQIPLDNVDEVEAHKQKLIAHYAQKQQQRESELELIAFRERLFSATSFSALCETFKEIFKEKFNQNFEFGLTATKIVVNPRSGVVDTNFCYLSFDVDFVKSLDNEKKLFLTKLVEIVNLYTTGSWGKAFLKFSAQPGSIFEKIAQWQHAKITKAQLHELQQERLNADPEYCSVKEQYRQSCVSLSEFRKTHAGIEQNYQRVRSQICQRLEDELNSMSLEL